MWGQGNNALISTPIFVGGPDFDLNRSATQLIKAYKSQNISPLSIIMIKGLQTHTQQHFIKINLLKDSWANFHC